MGTYEKKSETFTFDRIPQNADELKAISNGDLTSPFKTCALTMLSLLNYQNNEDDTIGMLEYLNGPDNVSPYDRQFLKDRLNQKEYVVRSFFKGASVENNYTPDEPLQITVFDNPYSYNEQGYAILYLQSSGADSPRSIKLRCKASTNEWFMVENHTLSDIRIPKESDPWA